MDDLKDRMLKIKMVIMDVDGVLTDGHIVLGNYGDELKFFDVQDGMGLVLLRNVGIKTVVVSAKKSRINHRRAKDVQIVKVYENAHDKFKVYEKILRKFNVKPEEVCFIGDDLVDLPVLRRVGLGVAVHNAVQEVKEHASYITEKRGGHGAVREVTDMILKAQGKWEKATERYFR